MESDHRKFDDKQIDLLCEAFAAIRNKEECMDFLEDLMTIREIQDMTQRLYVAKLLREGKAYQAVMEEVSVSSATISRVNRCLNYGAGGYRRILDRIAPRTDDGEKRE